MKIFRNYLLKIWNSPTFTGLGVKLTRPLRLLLVTPLVLTSFSEVEIAAWYLFASISLFGNLIRARIELTFQRMISMAHGGATDLSPVKKAVEREGKREPNWEGIYRVFRCLSLLQAIVVLFTTAITTVIGYWTLRNIVSGQPEASIVYRSFAILMMTSFFNGAFGYLAVTIRGLGNMALVSRWNIVSSLVSVVAGASVLALGGGMLILVIVMQVTVMLVLLRNFWLISRVNGGRLKGHFLPKWDQQVWSWAWQPLWKGAITQFANHGVLQLSSLILSFYAATAQLSAFLLSVSLLSTAKQLAMTPFFSQQPRFSRLMSAGKLGELRSLASRRILICQVILLLFVLGGGVVGPVLLSMIGAKATLLEFPLWCMLGFYFFYERFNTYNLAVCAAGNSIQLYWRQAFTGGVCLVLLWFLIPSMGALGAIISLLVPSLLLMNFSAAKLAAKQLGASTSTWLRASYIPFSRSFLS